MQDPRHDCSAGPSACGSTGVVALLAFAIVAAFWGLDAGPPLSDHEAIVAQCARQIRQSGDWVIPYFNDVPFIRKPPLQPWLVAAVSLVVDPPGLDPPVSPLAARFPAALAAVLLVVTVLALGRAMFHPRTAVVGGGLMACCAGALFFSHNAQVEMLLSLLTTASMACFYGSIARPGARVRYLAGFYVLLGLAMLAKAPMPLAVVVVPLFAYWFVTVPVSEACEHPDPERGPLKAVCSGMMRQLPRLRQLWLLPGAVLFLAIAAPWPVYVYRTIDNALPLWRTEFIDRYTGALSGQQKPFWYYLPLVFVLTAPFCLSIPQAFAAPFRRVFHRERPGLLFAFTWVVVDIAFLSTSAFKRPHYLLPVLPGLCILLAPVIDRMFLAAVDANAARVRRAIVLIWIVAAIGTPIGLAALHKNEPAMFWTAGVGVPVLLAAVVLAGCLFRTRRRVASLLVVCVLPLLLFAWCWSSLGRNEYEGAVVGFAARLRELSHRGGGRITWAIGRPDARVGYYAGFQIDPLYSPLEMTGRRAGRREVPREILLEGARRIAERLDSRTREYFIFDDMEKLRMFRMFPAARYRELMRVRTNRDDPDAALVLITNAWNTD